MERYLLEEMTPEARDDFEEHCFFCEECSNEVRTGMSFVQTARNVLPAIPPPQPWGWRDCLRLQWAVPALASLALATVVAYQNWVVIPALHAPQSFGQPVILEDVTRGALPGIHSGSPLRFEMALETPPRAQQLKIAIHNAAGKVVRSGSLKTPGPGEPLDVYFPGRLNPGRYTFSVYDPSGSELGHSRFEILIPGDSK